MKPGYTNMKWEVPFLAKVFYLFGAIKLYHYGTSYTGVAFINVIFRKWHPLTWAAYALSVIPCAIMGQKLSEFVPTDMADYYKQPENLYWVKMEDWK